jgi:hypothetical protein
LAGLQKDEEIKDLPLHGFWRGLNLLDKCPGQGLQSFIDTIHSTKHTRTMPFLRMPFLRWFGKRPLVSSLIGRPSTSPTSQLAANNDDRGTCIRLRHPPSLKLWRTGDYGRKGGKNPLTALVCHDRDKFFAQETC